MLFGRKNAAKEERASGPGLLAKLLLVVDGSEPSIAAANFAVRLAARDGSSIAAVYVVDTATMDYLMQMRIFVTEEREEFEEDLHRTGTRYLEYVSAIAGKNNVTVETVLRTGRFHRVILKEAAERGVDAIVLGGWHRTVTRKDSTSVERQLILDQADCPVIVVKGADG